MEVKILKAPTAEDWKFVYKCCMVTQKLSYDIDRQEKEPPLSWKEKILEARHSPIRTLTFDIYIKGIPAWVKGHYVRHKIGVEHFVSTSRNDRQKDFDRNKAPQDAPLNMIMHLNAESLITIAQKRLCGKASAETQTVMKMIVAEILKTNPEFAKVLVKPCIYNPGICHEMKPCNQKER